MTKKLVAVTLLSTLLLQAQDHSQHAHHNHADIIAAPVGVHGDHVHGKGTLMLGLARMNMSMDGNIQGSSDIDAAGIGAIAGYNAMMAPKTMDMQMDMLHVMYGLSSKLAVMAMVPTIESEMLMNNDAVMNGNGLGDIGLGLSYQAKNDKSTELVYSLTVNLPTGSIDETMANGNTAPYPMQTGSGSYALVPTVTYIKKNSYYAMGSQVEATMQLNDNEQDYKLGNKYMAQAWFSYAASKSVALSARLQYNSKENISGADTRTSGIMSPTADEDSQAYQNALAYYGINYEAKSGVLKGHSIGLEYGVPVYQNADNIHMKWDNSLIVSWEKVF